MPQRAQDARKANVVEGKEESLLIAGGLNGFVKVASLLLRMGADAATEKGTKSDATSQQPRVGGRDVTQPSRFLFYSTPSYKRAKTSSAFTV